MGTLSYSLVLKRAVLVDVIVLAGLYTVRLLAGAAATRVDISPWFAAFSVFLFLSLAMVKRFSELQNTRVRGQALANGRGYQLGDIEQLRSFGTSNASAAVLVFLIYVGISRDVNGLYHHPNRLWLDRAADDLLDQPGMAAGFARRTRRRSCDFCRHRPHQPADGRGGGGRLRLFPRCNAVKVNSIHG